MITLAALYLYHRRLGYGRRTSIRLALWCMNPNASLYEPTKEQA